MGAHITARWCSLSPARLAAIRIPWLWSSSFTRLHGSARLHTDGGEENGGGTRRNTDAFRDESLRHPIAPWVRTVVSGVDLLRNPKYNKGMAFDDSERERMYLRGLLPPGRWSQETQVERVLAVLDGMDDQPLAQYTFMMGLQERNEKLFFRVLIENLERLMPIIYSPTVSLACAQHGLLYRRPRGLFITSEDRGSVLQILKNWPEKRIKLIAVSDGQNVLGLGDMGIAGMGNLVGKLSLYTACAGFHPSDTLPVIIDVGTDNETLLRDKFYLGLRKRRVGEEEYLELMDEFMEAVKKRFGARVLVQFENFAESMSRSLVNRFQNYCVFNDDQQGIATAALAAILAATTKDVSDISGNFGPLSRHTFLFAGESGLNTSIPDMLTSAISKETKLLVHEVRKRMWLISGKGLVVRAREDTLQDKCLPYAHDYPTIGTLVEAIKKLKPRYVLDTP